jgi:hypothetical protein
MDDPRITPEGNQPPAPPRSDYDDRDYERRPPPRADYQYQKDRDHLNLLSIFYWVFFGFECFGLILLPVEAIFFVGMFSSMPSGGGGGGGAPPAELGYIMAGFMGVMWLIILVVAICLGLTAYYLRKRTHWTFCFVIACILCINLPLGTILGVFTILVLQRPSVKELFQHGGRPPGDRDAYYDK